MNTLHYHCLDCGRPVEHAIEGILRCADCLERSQMTTEEIAESDRIQFLQTHCLDCNKFLCAYLEYKTNYCLGCWNDIQAGIKTKPGNHCPDCGLQTFIAHQELRCPDCGLIS